MESTATRLSEPQPPIERGARLYFAVAHRLDALQPLLALALRLYVARVFFTSGMIKIGNWAGTLGLFQNEFHVPLLRRMSPPCSAPPPKSACPCFSRWGSAPEPPQSRCSSSISSR